MSVFVFTGDPRMEGKDYTDACELFGMVFPRGEAVKVDDDAVAARLRRHSHFTEKRMGRPPKVIDE